MKRHWFTFLCGFLVVVIFVIRQVYGYEVAKGLLPYFIAGPSAYVLLRLFYVFRSLHRAEKATAAAKAPTQRYFNIYASILLAAWIVLNGLGVFQHWVSMSTWGLLFSLALLVLLIAPRLILNRLTLGVWLVKRRPSGQSSER